MPTEPSRDADTVLQIDDLALGFRTRRGMVNAVRDISLTVARGEAVALVGESGCGKSTVAFAAMGHLDPNAVVRRGRVAFRGQDLLRSSETALQRLRGRELAMIYQDPMTTLNPSFRIGDQLIEVLMVHRHQDVATARRACTQMLRRVHMPDPEQVMSRFPHQVSGGQQQRVIIAMALLCHPALLVMDEPTTALDVTVEAAILDHISDLRRDIDAAILFISHNLGVVARFCDRVAVMYAGELVETAGVHELFRAPRHPYTQGLLGCVPRITTDREHRRLEGIPGQVWPGMADPPGCIFAPRCAHARPDCHTRHPELTETETGHAVRCLYWRDLNAGTCGAEAVAATATGDDRNADPPSGPQAAPLLTVSGLKTYYRQKRASVLRPASRAPVKAVDGVDLTIAPGSIVGIVGESGCGKSSLAKTVAGLVLPTDGRMEFLGMDVTAIVERRDRQAVHKLNMIFQNPDSSLNPTKSIRQIIARPLRLARRLTRAEHEREMVRLLHAVKLNESYLERRPRQLSGGEKQRVAIARALASHPDLLVCDEPVSALDVSVQCSVLGTLVEIQQRFGTGLMFISHDLSVVRYLCDVVVVMYLGRICEIGPARHAFSPPSHPYTAALLSAVPLPDPDLHQTRIRLEGSPPSPVHPPAGCRFHTRCPHRVGDICATVEPPPAQAPDGSRINCHIPLAELARMPPVIQSLKVAAGG